jgi:hypothetical protein
MNATRAAVKPLNPRSPDTKYTGLEPTWRVQPTDDRTSQMSSAFSWYNYFYGKKDAREMLVAYLEHNGRKADVRALKGVPDSAVRLTTAWLCRMSMVGLELTDTETVRLEGYIQEILTAREPEVVVEEVVACGSQAQHSRSTYVKRSVNVPANWTACLMSLWSTVPRCQQTTSPSQ